MRSFHFVKSIMKNPEPSFIKCYNKLSYIFNPYETRFIQHMIEIEFIKSCGYDTNWSKATYLKRMGLKENTFDNCVKRFTGMKLLDKKLNPQGNQVYFSWNMNLYFQLVKILSVTNDVDRLIDFCKINFIERGRMIDEISEDEVEVLALPVKKDGTFDLKVEDRFQYLKADSKYSGNLSTRELLQENSEKLDFIISILKGEG